jgi:Zinc carboxypeptidase
MTVEVTGKSANGFDLYAVTINALDTEAQQRDFDHWSVMRKSALTDPARAQRFLAQPGGKFKLPIFIQAGIHGNESEGIDADMRLIERLATTPYGADPFVDDVLDHAVVIFNVIHNPDGHILNQRQNGNNFDLNRDWLTQSQPETKATVPLIQKWLAPELLDQHGYVTPTLIEATTKPHNPGIEYDFWLKWNQARIDANEAAMNAAGFAVTRPINDWCPEGDPPNTPGGFCDDGVTLPGPATAEGWDDWGPFYTPMYSQLVGLNGSTVEMCNSTGTACGVSPTSTQPRGRIGSREAQYTVATSTLTFDIANRQELWHDQLEIYRRGVTGAARPPCCPPPFDVANNWMHEYPEAYVIPVGRGQRSDAEANRLVEWLFFNGIRVWELEKSASFQGQTFDAGSYVVSMNQAFRGLADTALGIGVDARVRRRRAVDPDAEHRGERSARELRPGVQRRRVPVRGEPDRPGTADRLLRRRRRLHRRRRERSQLPDRRLAGLRAHSAEPGRPRPQRHRLLDEHRHYEQPDRRRLPRSGHGDHGSPDLVHGGAWEPDRGRALPVHELLRRRPLEAGCRVRDGAGLAGDRARDEHGRNGSIDGVRNEPALPGRSGA